MFFMFYIGEYVVDIAFDQIQNSKAAGLFIFLHIKKKVINMLCPAIFELIFCNKVKHPMTNKLKSLSKIVKLIKIYKSIKLERKNLILKG